MGLRNHARHWGADSAHALAARMVTYISDPRYIHAYVLREYGERRAPSLKHVERMRVLYERDRQDLQRRTERPLDKPHNDNGEHFQVNGTRLAKHRRAAPVETEQPALKPRLVPHLSLSQRILRSVAGEFNITVEQLRSTSRAHFYVVARSVAIRLLRDCQRAEGHRYSTPQIATIVGRNDHSTILHALATFETWMDRYPEAREIYERLKELTQ